MRPQAELVARLQDLRVANDQPTEVDLADRDGDMDEDLKEIEGDGPSDTHPSGLHVYSAS